MARQKKSRSVRTKKGSKPAAKPVSGPSREEPSAEFSVVGVGASAGGLEAFTAFLANLPADPGMAFVLVQHMDPKRKSMLVELLARHTSMEVQEISEGDDLCPNRVYVSPPNSHLAFEKGRWQVLEPLPDRHLPIDFFFRSLAGAYRERAICVVLSGTGSDGSLGLRAVKGEGGLVLVQAPETAAYDGMPRQAIRSGLADLILPVEELARELVLFSQRKLVSLPEADHGTPALPKLFALLRAHTGHDFSAYKQTTVLRRIERRIALSQVGNLEDYVECVKRSPGEIERLFKELLIGVTAFFRDPEAFRALETRVIPQLVGADRSVDHPIRVWVPGCSTGEEAYSLGMLLLESIFALQADLKTVIFATDINPEAIEFARAGVYPEGSTLDLSPERLERFFTKDGNTLRVKKVLRDAVVFAEQDLLRDPPFSNLDLISCRNLLIYLEVEQQKRILPLFHYALKERGFLLLGTAETVGEFGDLFEAVAKKWKIFRSRPASIARRAFIPVGTSHHFPAKKAPAPPAMDLKKRTEARLLGTYCPPCVVVDDRHEILFVHGRTGKYLEPATGAASHNLLAMAREGLKFELAGALRRTFVQNELLRCEDLWVEADGEREHVNVVIEPFSGEASRRMALVLFEALPTSPVEVETGRDRPEQRFEELEKELQATREYLQTSIEELETSNEELKSTNEELQSAIEELQSTNEELETSREELQSVNEELTTVNSELMAKIEELTRLNNDMTNLLSSTEIGTLFLDEALQVTRFTPAASIVFQLLPSDLGRPLASVACNLRPPFDEVPLRHARTVLENLSVEVLDVPTRDGRWFAMRTMPYRTVDNVIAGVVMTFVDISGQKGVEAELLLQTRAVQSGPGAVMLLDHEGRVQDVNPRFTELTGYGLPEVVGRPAGFLQLESGELDLEGKIWKTISSGYVWRTRRFNRKKDGGSYWEMVSVTPVRAETGQIAGYVVHTEEARPDRECLDATDDALLVLDDQGRVGFINRAGCEMLGCSEEEVIGRDWFSTFLPEAVREQERQRHRDLLEGQLQPARELSFRSRDGEERSVLWHDRRLMEESGQRVGTLHAGRALGPGP